MEQSQVSCHTCFLITGQHDWKKNLERKPQTNTCIFDSHTPIAMMRRELMPSSPLLTVWKKDNRTNTVLFLREDVKMKKRKCQKRGWYTALLKDCFVEKNWPNDLRKAFNRAVFGLQWRWKINENLFQVYFSLVIWQMRAKPGKNTSFNLQM